MADLYKDIATTLANRRQRFYDEQPTLQAALQMQPIYTRRDQNQTKGAIAGSLQALAKALMGAHGIKRAQENQTAYDRDFMNIMQSASPMEGLSADPRFAEVGSLIATDQFNTQRGNTAELDMYSKKAEIDAVKQNGIEISKVIASDPRFRRALADRAMQEQGFSPARSAGIALDPGNPMQASGGSPQENLDYWRDQGLDDNQAASMAMKAKEMRVSQEQKRNEPDLAATKAQLEAIPSELEKAASLDRIGDTVLATYNQAGYTGPMNSIRSTGMNIAAMLGNSDQQAKLEAQTRLDSVLPEVIKQARTVGGGAVSDYESKLFVASGPSSNQPPEVNQFFGQLYKARARLAREEAAFKQEYARASGGTLAGSQQLWQQLTGGRPLVEQGPDGKPRINQLDIPWREALQGGQQMQPQGVGQQQAPVAGMTNQQSPMAQPAAQPQANMPQGGEYPAEVRQAIEARKAQLRQQVQQ